MKKLGFCLVFITMFSTVVLSQMIFLSDYEDGQLLAPGASKETTTSYGMKVDTNITKAGDFACRFEARHGDPIYGGSVRSEQKTGLIFDQTRGEVIWIGYSIYYPADMVNTSQEEIIGQFTQTTTSGSWHPCIGFKNQGDFTLRPYVRQGRPDKIKILPIFSFPKDEWVDFVWNIKFSLNDDGYIKGWCNGELKVDYSGKVGFPGSKINFKWGIYPGFKTDFTSQSPRIIYWDEIRIADSTADFSYVDPGAGTGLQSQIISFPEIPDKLTTDEWFLAGASSSSGLPVSYVSSDTTVAITRCDTVFIKDVGKATITAFQPGDTAFRAASSVERTFKVTDPSKMLQEIHFPAMEPKLTTDTAFCPGAKASSGLPVFYSSSDTMVAAIRDTLVILKAPGKTVITAFQPGNEDYNPADEVPGILIVSAPSTLPLPWHSADIGNPDISGRSYLFGGDYNIVAGGRDVWGTSDQFHFMYVQLGGECGKKTFNPSHDAYIRNDNTSYGTCDSILIKNGGGTFYREGYLKFDLGFLGCTEIDSAVLRLYCHLHAGGDIELFKVNDNSWTETAINWNNRPSSGSLISSAKGRTGYIEWDVKDFMNESISQGSKISFRIRATNDAYISLNSREAGEKKPELVFYSKSQNSNNGDGSIIAEVKSISNTNFNAKAGVMIRESLEPGSKMAYIAQRPNNEVAFDVRKETNGTAIHTLSGFSGGTAENKWLKLSRSGDTLSAYYSTDSPEGPWTELIEQQTIVMSNPVYAGIFVTSHNITDEAKGVFGDILLEKHVIEDTITNIKTTGLHKLTAYPNPLQSGMLTIEVNGSKTSSVRIFNIIGEKIYEESLNSSGNMLVPRSRFSKPGIYFIKLNGSAYSETLKITVL